MLALSLIFIIPRRSIRSRRVYSLLCAQERLLRDLVYYGNTWKLYLVRAIVRDYYDVTYDFTFRKYYKAISWLDLLLLSYSFDNWLSRGMVYL